MEDGSFEWVGFDSESSLDWLSRFGEVVIRDLSASRFCALFPEQCDQ
jgi:hypothetical protein